MLYHPPGLRSSLKALAIVALVAAALLAGTARPAVAAGSTPCWKTLLNDWYDGRIDGTYPLHCYQDALKHLPSDVDQYSSARDDIERALQSAREAARKKGQKVTGNTLVKPAGSGGKKTTQTKTTVTITEPRHKKEPGLAGLAQQADTGGPSSVPVPLLVLGGVALLLVAAGAGGLVLKRYQNRKPGN
jgi:hypothetical protein